MKKVFSNIMLMGLTLGVMFFSACSSSDDDSPANPSPPGTGTPGEVKTDSTDAQKSSQEQMQTLVNTANSFMSKINTADFNNVKQVTDALENIDNDEIADWAEGCVDAVINPSGSSSSSKIERPLWRASNFTGHFRQLGNRFVKENGSFDDLQATFTDNQGNTCVANVSVEGTETNVSASFLNYDDEDWDYDNGYTETRYENTYSIPKTVVAKLTQNGSEILRVTVNTTFNGSGQFPTQSSISNLVTTVKINNYVLLLNRAAVSSSQVNADLTLAVNNETLLHLNGTANGSYKEDGDENIDIEFGATNVTCDVMGKVQASFQTTNLQRVLEDAGEFEDYMNGNRAQSLVQAINSLSSGALYFDKNTVPSATIFFSASEDGYSSDGSSYYYELMPVLRFASDGREIAFEDYFTESNFQSVINTYNNLVRSFRNMFDI